MNTTQTTAALAFKTRLDAEADLAGAEWTAAYGTPGKRPVAAAKLPTLRAALAKAQADETAAFEAMTA